MQAIQTRYYGPTNTKPSRFKAWAAAGFIWVNYDHGLNLSDNHKAAAQALARKLQWIQPELVYFGGTLPCGDYCFVAACSWLAFKE